MVDQEPHITPTGISFSWENACQSLSANKDKTFMSAWS